MTLDVQVWEEDHVEPIRVELPTTAIAFAAELGADLDMEIYRF